MRHLSLSDEDDFAPDEVAPPSAKRSKQSPTLVDVVSDDSNDRASSPVFSKTKRSKKPIQLSIQSFTEVRFDCRSF